MMLCTSVATYVSPFNPTADLRYLQPFSLLFFPLTDGLVHWSAQVCVPYKLSCRSPLHFLATKPVICYCWSAYQFLLPICTCTCVSQSWLHSCAHTCAHTPSIETSGCLCCSELFLVVTSISLARRHLDSAGLWYENIHVCPVSDRCTFSSK